MVIVYVLLKTMLKVIELNDGMSNEVLYGAPFG